MLDLGIIHLNLPTSVSKNSNNIQYVYDTTGVKLSKTVNSYPSETVTQYAGNYIYENDELQFFNHAEGYVKNDNGIFSYIYQYKDHLGNVRLSYSDTNNDGVITASSDPSTNEIIEESNYYPFGLQHKGYNNTISSNGNSTAQKFKYNGIEYEESLGLNLYEMKFRTYDPAIGRFNGIDPVTHFSQGTSVAFDNNPIYWADPSGADASGADGLTNNQWLQLSRPGGGGHDAMRAQARQNFQNEVAARKKISVGEGSFEVDKTECCGFTDALFNAGLFYGVKAGGESTLNFLQSLGTSEGWVNLGIGFLDLAAMGDGMSVRGSILRTNLAIQVSDFVSRVPTMSSFELGYYTGYGIEKFAEAALLSKGAGSIRIPVYRVYGGSSLRNGAFFSFVNPRYVPFYNKFAGLPPGNTGSFLLKGKVTLGSIVRNGKVRPAARIGNNFGGFPELKINPKHVNQLSVSGRFNYLFKK